MAQHGTDQLVEPSGQFLRLIACPRPLSIEKDRIDRYVPEGATVSAHLHALGWQTDSLNARVFIDGDYIERAQWEYAVPQAGQVLTARVIPMGGDGGGGQGKEAGRIVAMIAVVVASIYTAGAAGAALGGFLGVSAATGSAIAGAAVSIIGTLAISALIPPASAKIGQLSGQTLASPSIAGAQNHLTPYAPIPRIYGRIKVFPNYGARPYTEIVGNDQYLRLLFVVGYGPLAISELKIGDTPLSLFSNVEVEIRQGYATDPPVSLYPDAVVESPVGVLITKAGGSVIRTSNQSVDELSVDLYFPEGLYETNAGGPGRNIYATVQANIEYRQTGTGPWTQIPDTLAVAASVTLGIDGANNDLVVTAAVPGSDGNNFSVSYSDEGESAAESVRLIPTSDTSYHIQVVLRNVAGVLSTSAQVKTAIETATSVVTVAHSPGNDGTGTVTALVPTYLENGRDAVAALDLFPAGPMVTPFRVNRRWKTGAIGQFDVRVTRLTDDVREGNFNGSILDRFLWESLRSIVAGSAVKKAGMAQIALRIRATNQLNGVLDNFNCVAESILPDWDAATNRWITRTTSNPASIVRDVHQGTANARPKTDSEIDLTALQGFHERCEAKGFTFNANIDFRTTVKELARDIMAAGRGTPGLRDGKVSVIEDIPQAVPVHVLTPRNSWGYRGHKIFADVPHGLRVRFVDPVTLQQDERVVLGDGHGITGADGIRRDAFGDVTTLPEATQFETVDAGLGVNDLEQIWKLQRYHLAVLSLRPETHTVHCDVEHLLFTRGDLIRLQHDVPLFGLGAGRVLAVEADGAGRATGVTIDEALFIEAGLQYGGRFVRGDGTQVVGQFVTVPGAQTVLAFAVPIPNATTPEVGNVVALGLYQRETVKMLVKSIEPGEDYSATIHLLDYAPGIQTADSGTIPPFESQITHPPDRVNPLPVPIVDQVRSDESVLLRDVDGSLQSRIFISLHFSSGPVVPIDYVEAQFRPTGTSTDWTQLRSSVSGTSSEVSITPVQDGEPYDIRLRNVSRHGLVSDWYSILNHVVIGKTTPPPDVPLLVFDGNFLRWSYPTTPPDLAGFVVKSRPGLDTTWIEGIALHDGVLTETYVPIVTDGIVRVFMVKAVDTAGNESVNPAAVIYAGGPIVLGNLAKTLDYRALGFPGTTINGTVVALNLTADSESVWWTNDDARFWNENAVAFWTGSYKTMTYTFTVTPDSLVLAGKMRLAIGVTAGRWAIRYRPDAQGSFWANDGAAFWTSDGATFWQGTKPDFMTWPGAIGPMSAQEYEFEIVAYGGQIQSVITALQVLFDMETLRESFPLFSLPVEGRRLPLTKTYQAVTSVQTQPFNDGGSMRRVAVMDHDYLAGPLLEGRDAMDAMVAGVCNVDVEGY